VPPRSFQVFLGSPTLRDVADVTDEGGSAGQVGPDDDQLGGELAPVGAQCGYLDTSVEDARLPGHQVPGETAPVGVAERWRHEHFSQLAAEHLIGPAAEHALGRGVDVGQAAAMIDADDTVQGRESRGDGPRRR
jgi:hypothetical protein